MHDLLFEKCARCHLFVEECDDGSVAFVHLSHGDDGDRLVESTHEAAPSDEIHTLHYWRVYGPAEMRARLRSIPYYDDPAVSGT